MRHVDICQTIYRVDKREKAQKAVHGIAQDVGQYLSARAGSRVTWLQSFHDGQVCLTAVVEWADPAPPVIIKEGKRHVGPKEAAAAAGGEASGRGRG